MTTESWVLPQRMAERARLFAEGREEPAAARVAATVVLLRSAATSFEVYAIRRAASMAFASGMYAFPGGSVDPSDLTDVLPGTAPRWGERLGIPVPQAWAVVRAAIREVGEESGVRLSEELLLPWARWITPDFEPRRFDTYFFLAVLPDGADTPGAGDEFDEAIWVRPAEALARYAAGEIAMLPPTVVTLREIASHQSIEALLAAAADRDAATPVRPRVAFAADGTASLEFPTRTGR
jgi:8-oxo-dGTP pyrophosphatase MutT (NUDIX family)